MALEVIDSLRHETLVAAQIHKQSLEGLNVLTCRRREVSLPVAAQSGVTAMAAGWDHTVALLGSGPVTPVSLNARSSGNELILSWPANVVGFTLQSTLNLTPPVTWIDSTQSPAVIGAQFTVTQTISGSAQFYRLRKP